MVVIMDVLAFQTSNSTTTTSATATAHARDWENKDESKTDTIGRICHFVFASGM
jgi:hypothetical protein